MDPKSSTFEIRVFAEQNKPVIRFGDIDISEMDGEHLWLQVNELNPDFEGEGMQVSKQAFIKNVQQFYDNNF